MLGGAAVGGVGGGGFGAGEDGGFWGQAVALQAFPGVNSKLSWVAFVYSFSNYWGNQGSLYMRKMIRKMVGMRMNLRASA